VTLGAEQLRGIPEVIAVVTGATKEAAVRAALCGGLVHSLVVDAELARALLREV
jgi:DNA-binding transcriptional regulator LsrR (DeoR family)